MKHEFCCYGCWQVAETLGPPYLCPVCGEPMALRALATPSREIFSRRPDSLWDYFDLLPIASRDSVVSMGEGGTPLAQAPRLGKMLGFSSLQLKNEMANPTGSFKDRQVSVGISRALELGKDTVAVVSSGNVACAAAAYAARAGMRAVLMMHGHASPDKMLQAAVYGGAVVAVDTPSAQAVFDLCIEACAEFGWYHLSTAGMYEPFNVEGAKTIAYELFAQSGGELPDWVVAPVGGGGLLGGIWRGFLDLKRLGFIGKIPKLAGAQAAGCAPLKKAVDTGTRFLETLRDPWPNPKTIAGGIADDILFDGHTVLPAIRTTGGAAISVTDAEILAALHELARTEGLWCEPTAAAAVAALRYLPVERGKESVCCLLTGSGMKDPKPVREGLPAPLRIGPSLEELRRELK